MNELSLVADARARGGIRLDQYCSLDDTHLTRSRLKTAAREITVNGKTAKLSRTVREGDRIRVLWIDPVPETIQGEDIPLTVVYEDENVTVINKAQGMVTHPAAGNWSGTLVNALMWRWQRDSAGVQNRSGIVHRLDKDTSGLIITARTIEAEQWLSSQFRRRKTKKVYAAILQGIPKERRGDIRIRLVRDGKNRKRYTWTLNPEKGKDSHTSYRVIKTYGSYSLVLFRLHTGRTHQLRVHSKFLGTPILGDPVYGKKDVLFPDATLMLHAMKLAICLPGDKKAERFYSPVPPRFRRCIAVLKQKWP